MVDRVESFEAASWQGDSGWAFAPGNDFEWTMHAGATLSAGTGPSSAFTGSHYIYTESSSPNFPRKVAALQTCADVPLDGYLTFAYHAFGSTMGNFSVDVLEEGSSSWSPAFSVVGAHGDA